MKRKSIKERFGVGLKLIGFFFATIIPAFAVYEDYYESVLPYSLIGGGVLIMIGEWLGGEKARWMLPMIAALLSVLFLLVYKQTPLFILFMILSLTLTVVLYLIERKEKRDSPVQVTDEKRAEKWW